MKQCPFCKAEIEDNARFCLYCMTSLEDKQATDNQTETSKRWLYLLAAVFVLLIVIGGGVWLALSSDDPSLETGGDPSGTPVVSQSQSNTTSTLGTGENSPSGSLSAGHSTTGTKSTSVDHTGSGLTTTTTRFESSGKTGTTDFVATTGNRPTKTTNAGASPTPSQTGTKTTRPSTPSSTASTTAPPVSAAVYTYRDARYGDSFYIGANLDDCVVITGISAPSADGVYTIPDTIGGKKVVSIMGGAFSDASIRDTVKRVVVPASVKTIWNYAFASCYNMTDIYFCGNTIYTEAQAFADNSKRTGTLTIHCSATCNDGNFRYYKNNASGYDAIYNEWNG